jgi:hypothetical protein
MKYSGSRKASLAEGNRDIMKQRLDIVYESKKKTFDSSIPDIRNMVVPNKAVKK